MFYQRDIASKRLLTSIGMGIITSVALIIIQLIFSLISSELSYASLIKELSRTVSTLNGKCSLLYYL